jgi:hypothetical protein
MRSIETGAPTSRKTAASESIIYDASSRRIRNRQRQDEAMHIVQIPIRPGPEVT